MSAVQSPANPEARDQSIVHIVDDDTSLCLALEELFGSVGLATCCYRSAREFLDTKPSDLSGCIIIDIRLPDMNGLEFQAQLTALGILLPAVIMTGYGDVPMTVRAMKGGAVDFLLKPFRDQDILDAVLAAIRRDRERRAAEVETSGVRKRFETLSLRERQIMAEVVAGKLNKQIAGLLGLSEVTVKVHRGSVMRKMGARTFADLVRMAAVLRAALVFVAGNCTLV
jgi:FixJ family two-component response regulator